MTATHALRDRWFVSFLPLITSDTVNAAYGGDWTLAAKERMERLDWVTSVEELWSTINSLPKPRQLGVGATFIFARRDAEPSFENFPRGSRVVANLFRSPATEIGLEVILAVVVGETISEAIDSEAPVCDVIRIAARPSREHADMLRVEVWLNDGQHSAEVVRFLRNAFRENNIADGLYSIVENPFDNNTTTTHNNTNTTSTKKEQAAPSSSTVSTPSAPTLTKPVGE